MAQQILNVRFSEKEEYFIKDPKNPGKVLKRWRDQTKSYVDDITVRYAEGSAVAYFKLMRSWLTRGHQFRVGASNQARDNLFIKQGKTGDGYAAWVIEEGDLTPANQKIRSGIRGHGVKRIPRGKTGTGKANNRTPVINSLRLWAAQKGIELKLGGQKWKAQFVQTKGGKAYGRAVGGKRQETNVVLWLIRRKLWEKGTQDSHWKELYPSGSGRFDYVGYAVRFVDHKENLGRAAMGLREAIVQYLYSGRKKGMGEKYFK